MFNATYFHYDGQWSGKYGLVIADFDLGSVQETDTFSPSLSLIKVPGSPRFSHGGIEYDSAPTCEFSVVSEMDFNSSMRKSIMSWLLGKNQFKPLRFDGGDNSGFTYYCVFTSIKTIWVNGRCHGFRITAQFDSPYARGTPTVVTVGEGTHVVTIRNMSAVADDYTYPTVQFTGGSIDIVNITDDEQRHFTFAGLAASEVVTVDNEMKFISGSMGGEKLSNFTSKRWLRLRQGYNTLHIEASGDVTITCPHYAMIGY